MTALKVAELKVGNRLAGQVTLDKQFVLLDSTIPFTEELQKALVEWNFKEVYCEEKFVPEEAPKPKAPLSAAPTSAISTSFESVDFDLDALVQSTNGGISSQLISAVEKAKKEIPTESEEQKFESVEKVYGEFLNFITKVFTRFVTHKELDLSQIAEGVKSISEFIRSNKKYLLRIQPKPEQKQDKNFLVSHCARSTVFSVVIADQLKWPPQRIADLGTAAILHEIGQIKLPPQLYVTNKPLSVQGRAVLSTHSILGFNILKEHNFPAAIQLGVLEHHERENGKGYPRKIDGSKISTFGKILAVACVYEAISSPRQYKEAKSTHEAIVEMLRNNERQYDDTIIKALVRAVSLFPIGAYVYLSNGKIAQVADSNPNDPRTPLVQVLGEKNELGNPKIVMTDNDKMRIARVVNRDELKDILKYLA
ncbi:MAG: HD-GYP domain-containing protein [Treponema sp.]|nr:HD-GYP domain-containing protein [Candidatus Treponema equifaecale]